MDSQEKGRRKSRETAKKEAKFLARKQQEEEAAKAAEEEKRRKAEEDKRAAEAASNQKKLREKEKKLLCKERTRLRALSVPVVSKKLLGLLEDDVEAVCMSLDMEQLRNLCDEAERQEGTERALLLRDVLGGDNNGTNAKQDKKNLKCNGSLKPDQNENGVTLMKTANPLGTDEEKKEKPWSREEIAVLRKGVKKYPKGTSWRWEVVSEYIGMGRSVEEILNATKTVLLQKPDSAKAFDSFLEKRKPAQSISSPLTTRTEVEGVPGAGIINGAPKSEPEQSSNEGGRQQVTEAEPAQSGVSLSPVQDVWSATQKRALIQALKTFPKEMSQRWERVAAAVPGKTMVQCRKKFMLLKENFRNKKSAD